MENYQFQGTLYTWCLILGLDLQSQNRWKGGKERERKEKKKRNSVFW